SQSIAIVIYEQASSDPAHAFAANPGYVCHISKLAITIVVIKNVLTEIADEEIYEAVVVVVTNANALSPAGVGYAGLHGNVCECSVTIILEKMRRRLLALGETFQARSVHQENVEPAVVVVIVKSNAGAGGLK